MNAWRGNTKCHVCGSIMNKKKFRIEGNLVRGWECPKCKEGVLLGADAQFVLMMNKLKKGLPVKIGNLGNSLIMRIPKQAAEFFKIKKGKDVLLKIESNDKMLIEVK